MWNNQSVLVVIPCYKVAAQIEQTVNELPDWIDGVVLVNDASPDQTGVVLRQIAQNNPKVTLIEHKENKGVGGAMKTGFEFALNTSFDLIIKLDGDGQMDATFIPFLLDPLSTTDADYSKGNRFNDFKALQRMPFVRRAGNLGLSFLLKAASGYWDVFDPTNGFFAIKKDIIKKLDLSRLSERYFFESSLLIELYYTGAIVKDVPMPAIYGEEVSNLSVSKTLFTFPPKLIKATIRRILLKYFIYDFNLTSLYILAGIPMFVFGLVFGIIKWIEFARIDIAAPTGTVMLSVLPFILGFQMLLSATQHDVKSKNPFKR